MSNDVIRSFNTLHFDNIKINQWITVSQYVGGAEETPFGTHTPNPSFDGVPLRVIAKSCPFVAVTNGNKIFSLDMRQWGVQSLTRSYIKAMRERDSATAKKKVETQSSTRKRKKKEKPDRHTCTKCGGMRVQKLTNPGSGKWVHMCRDCGFSDDGPEEQSQGAKL